MRILAASDTPLDSPRAHTINVVKTTGGFRRAAHETLLCARFPESASPEAALDALGESGLACLLAQQDVACSSHDGGTSFGKWIAQIVRETAPELVYARHFDAAVEAATLGLPTVLETHAYIGDSNPALLGALQATRSLDVSVATISERLRAYYVARGADPSRVHIVPDGVDTDLFEPSGSSTSPFEGEGPHAVYAGHLYDYKGVPAMLDAAGVLKDVRFQLVGGLDADIERARDAARDRGLDNVTIHGRVAHREVPRYLWHADALLLPPSALEPSKDWTSPVKLGEYLASSTPIVCTDIPALRDWIPGDLVEWARADDGSSLASAIGRSLELDDRVLADRACRAMALARSLSYPHRARAIVRAALGAGGLRVAA